MQKRRAIREKLLLGALLVGVMVAVLSASSFLGVYSYRRLVRALSSRAAELPRASELGECVGMLRLSHARALADDGRADEFHRPSRPRTSVSILAATCPRICRAQSR